ncbi:TonB-dependent siderophore receptor [Lyngbya confervoides]|uniref:TonB-dependent siderophore receptor n=1 Tax=Lyngbya confervoides BDU141951 TaxID=1574623 RepID=A0ABD4T3K7_9CYAN|nr:TonB-dependent siderophore receptor [Lyngbya confervoides]MCM1982900.1 TonB-dependent siderophore receptor [Lyngbya confervoides BDU141951]
MRQQDKRGAGQVWAIASLVLGTGMIIDSAQANAENFGFAGLDVGHLAVSSDDPTHHSTHQPTAIAQGLPLEITAVQIIPQEAGLDLRLETSGGDLPLPIFERAGNEAIAEIPNARLVLPEGSNREERNPIPGIERVQVNNLPGDRVQIVLVGTDAAPQIQPLTEAGQLQVRIVPGEPSSAAINEAPVDGDEIEITVTAERDPAYNPRSSSTATGTETPLRDVPFSVQIVPEAVIEDRNALELGKALETTPGVINAGGRGTSVFGPGFLIRGFEANDGIFRDGISTFSLSPLSTNDIERVEVLKGPASVLFGQGEPGGIINLVSKRPLDEPFYEISGTIGSFETYAGAVDLSGPLNAQKNLKYRLNLSYENYGSFRDFVNGERFIVSPILTWEINDKASLDVFGQYAYNRETIDEGLPLFSQSPTQNAIIDLPRRRFLNEDFGEFSQDEFKVGYRFNYDWNEDWSLRHSLQYLQYDPQRLAPLFNDFVQLPSGDLERLEYFAGGSYKRLFTNGEIIGRFQTGPVKHQLRFGVEYRHDVEKPEFQFDNLFAPINGFNPVYTNVPYAIDPTFFRDDQVDTFSLYLQDQIEFIPQLKLLAGLRYDRVSQLRTTRELGNPREEFRLTDEAFTPRVGLVYQPIEPVSLYASYTTSFNPAFGASRNADGSPFEPQTGRQVEVGIKADLSDRFSLNLAAFDIRKQNVATDNPDTPDPFDQIQAGEVASRGLELNLGGEILPGWNLIGGYTYLDAFVSQDNTIPVGNRLANAPAHQFSLWTSYEVPSGDLAGLGAGLGLFYVEDRQGDIDNSFTLPSYFRTDAALFYKRDNWRVQINLENLFNERYFTASNFGFSASPGAPFNVSASFAITF